MDSYYDDHRVWSADDPSNVTKATLARIREKYNILNNVHFHVPGIRDLTSRPPRGQVTLYTEMFKNGLRLPLELWMQHMMSFIGLAPH